MVSAGRASILRFSCISTTIWFALGKMVQIEIRCFCPISPPWDILPLHSAFDPYRSVIIIVTRVRSTEYGVCMYTSRVISQHINIPMNHPLKRFVFAVDSVRVLTPDISVSHDGLTVVLRTKSWRRHYHYYRCHY